MDIYSKFDPPASLLLRPLLRTLQRNRSYGRLPDRQQIFYMSPDDLLRQSTREHETHTLRRMASPDAYSGPLRAGGNIPVERGSFRYRNTEDAFRLAEEVLSAFQAGGRKVVLVSDAHVGPRS